MYTSKYYTCEQIDQRLLQGYYEDAVAAGYTGSKAQYLAGLVKAINHSANPTLTADKVVYNPATSGLTYKNIQDALDEVSSIGHFAKRGGIVNISTNYNSTNTAEVLTLPQVLSKVPSTDKVLGFQGKYLATDGWHTIIYIGDSLTSWSDTTKWIDLSDKILRSISENATFAGIATPTTNPGTPDGNVFYIASQVGTYSNFGGIEVAEGEAVILQWNDGAWTKKTTGLASHSYLIDNIAILDEADNEIKEELKKLYKLQETVGYYKDTTVILQNKGLLSNRFCNETGQYATVPGQIGYGYRITAFQGKKIKIKCSNKQNAIKYAFYRDVDISTYEEGKGSIDYIKYITSENVCENGIGNKTLETEFDVIVPIDANLLLVSNDDDTKTNDNESVIYEVINDVPMYIRENINKKIQETSTVIGMYSKVYTYADIQWENKGIAADGYPYDNINYVWTDYINVNGYHKLSVTVDAIHHSSVRNGKYYCFYDKNKVPIKDTINICTVSVNLDVNKYIEIYIPSNAYYFAAGFRKTSYSGFFAKLYSYKDAIKSGLQDAKSKADTLYSKLYAEEALSYRKIFNYYINSDGLLSSNPGVSCKLYDVGSINGKKLHIKQIISSKKTLEYNFCFYSIDYNLFNPSIVTEETVIERPSVALKVYDDEIIVPVGAKTLFCFNGILNVDATDTPVTNKSLCEVSVIHDVIENIPTVDNTGYPQFDKDDYWKGGEIKYGPNIPFKTIYTKKGLVYGGAELCTQKHFVYIGDSMVQNCAVMEYLSQLSGMYNHGYPSGGRNSMPIPTGYDSRNNRFNHMQANVSMLIQDNPSDVDFIIFENFNDLNLWYYPDKYTVGTIDDAPFFASQYIEYDNGYSSESEAKEGFDTHFSEIISNAEVKRGSIINVKYGTTAYSLLLSGTPNNGTFTIHIGDKTYVIETFSSQTLEDIASNIATFDFEGYASSSNGNTVTLTLQSGRVDVPPTISDNISGLSVEVSKTANSTWVFFYFKGYTNEEFKSKSNWTTDIPTIYSVYKGIFEELCKNFPTSKILIWQPLRMGYDNTSEFSYPDGSLNISAFQKLRGLPEWAKCRKVQSDVAELYNIEVVDSQKESCCNIFNKTAFYGKDQIHHNNFASKVAAISLYRHINV